MQPVVEGDRVDSSEGVAPGESNDDCVAMALRETLGEREIDAVALDEAEFDADKLS